MKLVNKKNEDPLVDLPKIPVPTWRAIQVWREEFIKYNAIPSIVQVWADKKDWNDKGEPPLVAVDPHAVTIRNEEVFVDPSGQTGDRFLKFEVFVTRGDRAGMLVAVISIDYGEKFIRENWNMRIKDHRSDNRYNLEYKKYPLTSAKDLKSRLFSQMAQLRQGGYSEEDLQPYKELIDKEPEEANNQQQTGRRDYNRYKRSPIASEEEVMRNQQQEDDEDQEETPESDAERYRERRAR